MQRNLSIVSLIFAVLALSACASTSPATPEMAGKTEKGALKPVAANAMIDLSAFKLQTLDASGEFLEIPAEKLVAGYTQKLFYPDVQEGSLVFAVPSNGASTKNTKYSRTELRQTGAQGDWALMDPVRHVMRVKLRVMEVAEKKPQTIIGQIHGSEKFSEMIKLRWTGFKAKTGYVEARFKTNDDTHKEIGVKLAEGLSLGDMIDYTISMQSGVVTVTVNGQSTSHTYTPAVYGSTDKYYFKAGNYLQYNDEPPVTGIVKMYSLKVGVE